MKSKKITSIKQAEEIIEWSNVLEIDKNDDNLITWWDGGYANELGYLYKDSKSRKIYMMLGATPSILRAIGKVFKYEIICTLYGGRSTNYTDTTILWLKEAVNE